MYYVPIFLFCKTDYLFEHISLTIKISVSRWHFILKVHKHLLQSFNCMLYFIIVVKMTKIRKGKCNLNPPPFTFFMKIANVISGSMNISVYNNLMSFIGYTK